MKNVTITFNLYDFDELSDKAKQKAIEEHRQFLLNVTTVEDFVGCGDPEYGDTPESMYEEEIEAILNDDTFVSESINANEYLFFESGELANTQYYVGNQPKEIKRKLTFHGMTVDI